MPLYQRQVAISLTAPVRKPMLVPSLRGERMDLKGRTLWQIGAGDTDRSYGHICKTFDVMIAGPGVFHQIWLVNMLSQFPTADSTVLSLAKTKTKSSRKVTDAKSLSDLGRKLVDGLRRGQ